MATAKKRGNSWRVQVYSGGIMKSFTAPTKKEAEWLAAEWQIRCEDKKNSGFTFKEAAEEYIQNHNAVCSPKTIREQKSMLRHIPDDILGMYVLNIDDNAVQYWINEMSRTKAPKTVRNYYGFFSAVIHAYNYSYRCRVKLPQNIKREIYIPTHEEVAHLLEIYEKTDGEMFTAVQMAASMGLRRGETCALENNKGNFQKRKIDIHQAFVLDEDNVAVLKTTKSYTSNRILTAPQFVADNLLNVPKSWKYVIKSKPNNITDHFNYTVKKEFDNRFTFHDLRHYFCSVCIAEGVPERYIMNLMGHSTPNLVRNVYGHIMADKEDEISRSLNAVFSEKISPRISPLH